MTSTAYRTIFLTTIIAQFLSVQSSTAQPNWNRAPFRVDVATFIPSDTIGFIPRNEIRTTVKGAVVEMLDTAGNVVSRATYEEGWQWRPSAYYRFDSIPHQRVVLRISHPDFLAREVEIDGVEGLNGGIWTIIHPDVPPVQTDRQSGETILLVNLGQETDIWSGSYHFGYRPYPAARHLLVLEYVSGEKLRDADGEELVIDDSIRTIIAEMNVGYLRGNECGKALLVGIQPGDTARVDLWSQVRELSRRLEPLGVRVGLFGGLWQVVDQLRGDRRTTVQMLGPAITFQLRRGRLSDVDSLLDAAISPLSMEAPDWGTNSYGINYRRFPSAMGVDIFDAIDRLLRSGWLGTFEYTSRIGCAYLD